MPEGFRIPDEKAKGLRTLLANERRQAKMLKMQREMANAAIKAHLEARVLPPTKAWLQARNELADYMRGIWRDQYENHKAWMNGDGPYDGSRSCAKAQAFLRNLRMCSEQVKDSAGDIARTSAPLFGWTDPDDVYKNPTRIDFVAKAPADTKEHILEDLDCEGEDEDEAVVPGVDPDEDETDNDDLIEGLEGLSTQELDDFLSTVEGGLNVEELEKALAKLEG